MILRPRRCPQPSSTPSHTGADDSITTSAANAPGSPSTTSTASLALTRACTRRSAAGAEAPGDPRDHHLEAVEHRGRQVAPVAVGAGIDAHQPFEGDADLGRRLDPEPGHVDDGQPGPGRRGLGGEGEGEGRGGDAAARHRLAAHQGPGGQQRDQRIGDGQGALAGKRRGGDGSEPDPWASSYERVFVDARARC